MIEKTVTLQKIGYRCYGQATLKLWDGGTGEIEMDRWDIEGTLTKEKLLNGINDGRFGCESILDAEIRVYEVYQEEKNRNQYEKFLSYVTLPKKRCMQGLRGI